MGLPRQHGPSAFRSPPSLARRLYPRLGGAGPRTWEKANAPREAFAARSGAAPGGRWGAAEPPGGAGAGQRRAGEGGAGRGAAGAGRGAGPLGAAAAAAALRGLPVSGAAGGRDSGARHRPRGRLPGPAADEGNTFAADLFGIFLLVGQNKTFGGFVKLFFFFFSSFSPLLAYAGVAAAGRRPSPVSGKRSPAGCRRGLPRGGRCAGRDSAGGRALAGVGAAARRIVCAPPCT